MLNVFLFIELLGSANADASLKSLKALELQQCSISHAVKLNEEKLVAQIDCPDIEAANAALLQKITGVDGVVQANIIAVVKPRN